MGGIVEIRSARARERNALDALHQRSSYVWKEDRANLDAHPDALGVAPEAIAEGRVRVALGAGNQFLGFSVVDRHAGGVCELDDLFVDPAFMRQGIGRALVEDVVERAVLAGCGQLTVVAHPRNFPFYEAVGFARAEPARTRFGPATRMRRSLRTPNVRHAR